MSQLSRRPYETPQGLHLGRLKYTLALIAAVCSPDARMFLTDSFLKGLISTKTKRERLPQVLWSQLQGAALPSHGNLALQHICHRKTSHQVAQLKCRGKMLHSTLIEQKWDGEGQESTLVPSSPSGHAHPPSSSLDQLSLQCIWCITMRSVEINRSDGGLERVCFQVSLTICSELK